MCRVRRDVIPAEHANVATNDYPTDDVAVAKMVGAIADELKTSMRRMEKEVAYDT